MCDVTASLWAALGSPPLGAPLPPARSPAWRTAAFCLRTALIPFGVHYGWSSAALLWGALRGTRPPPRATWGALVAGVTTGDVVEAVRRSAGGGIKIATWNVRWLRNHHTQLAAAKRAAILRLLGEGCIVLLQETHWTPECLATWESSFPGCRVVSSCARVGPLGGPAGGVAVVVPPRYRVISHREVSAGWCIIVELQDLQREGHPMEVVNVYLPPDSRRAALGEVIAGTQPAQGAPPRRAGGGDINMCLWAPRNAQEAEDVGEFLRWASHMGLAPLGSGGRRPVGPGTREGIDFIGAPMESHWLWRGQARWLRGLSDHPCLVATRLGKPVSTARRCNPWALSQVPTSGIIRLRARFRMLENCFGIARPAWANTAEDGGGGRPEPGPCRDEHTGDPDAPCLLADGAPAGTTAGPADPLGGRVPPQGGPGGLGGTHVEGDEVAFSPALARYGRAYLTQMIQNWWRQRVREKAAGDPGAVLREAAAGSVPVAIAGPVREWLLQLGEDRELLTPTDARRLLGLWRFEQGRVASFCSRPVRARAPLPIRFGRQTFRERTTMEALRLPDGTVCTDPGRILDSLWRHRADLWTSVPELPASGAALLDRYFAGRQATFAPQGPTSRARITRHILRAGGYSSRGRPGALRGLSSRG